MVPVFDRDVMAEGMARPVNWRGRSGRYYALAPRRLEDFCFSGDELFLIALGPMVLWVGAAADLVADPVSRARFRLAMDCADRVFQVDARADAWVGQLKALATLEPATAKPGPPAAATPRATPSGRC